MWECDEDSIVIIEVGKEGMVLFRFCGLQLVEEVIESNIFGFGVDVGFDGFGVDGQFGEIMKIVDQG